MAFISRLFFICLWLVQLQCDVYDDRPKIKTVDGDIIIEPAYGKNVHIRPNGPQSNVYVGDVNLLSINKTSDNNQVHLQPAQNTPVPQDLLQRIEQLETLTASFTNIQLNITRLSQRIRSLNNRLVVLQNRLNSRGEDECQSHPCENGGTCLNLVNGYHCLCPSTWKGRNCDEDVNECRIYAGTDLGCQNGATCLNRPGSYECICKPGWYGLDCTRKVKDCSGGNYEMCGHGTCVPVTTGDGIMCICDQGWTTNGTHVACLTDVNECESGQGARCSVNPKVECINLPGSFRCGSCPAGYSGDGYTCYDINECLTIPNGGCSMSPMVSCYNTIGSRICGSCPPGYTGDGVLCTWRGSCSMNHGGCHPSAQCVESSALGSQVAQCICPIGMEGDGTGLHGCYISTGDNSTESCDGNPCGSHGSCHALRQGYTCICYQGYSGMHCERYNDYCSSNPCLNGGTCRLDENSSRGFRCECTALHSGNFCQSPSQPCGGVLNSEEGSITYPLSNHSYINNARCAWVIHTAPDKVINVTFTKFNLEYHLQCHYDFVQIHDGRSSASQLIGRFCGNVFPNGGNIISSHNNLYFWFRSDSSVAKTGFALHWTSISPQCGGEFNASTHGRISSPGSPGPYPPNRDCYYHIKAGLGKRIQLHFYQLDIEVHQNCSFDYIAIYDGGQTFDPLVNKYCNSTQPAPLESSGSELLVHFHSDESGIGKGFQISYAPIDGIPGCGGLFTTDKGEIVSPTFDGSYLHNLLCEYKIKTRPDTKIEVKLTSFDIENSFRCRYDYLKIYDGDSEDSRLVGKFCGKAAPPSFVSQSNSLYIIFKSDHTMAAGGFKLQYKSLCQKTIFGDSGIIRSPGYPLAYPKQTVCEFIVATTPGKAIELTFQDFDIEDNRYYNCQYDHVEVRDGPNANSTLMGRYCGGTDFTPPTQISTYNYMYIKFNSDMSIVGRGFYANYTTINIECGGIYRNPSGIINHPGKSNTMYRNDQICSWMIVAPIGTQIQLTWKLFELEEMSDCQSDYVELIEITEGSNANYTLAKYCGTTLPPAVTISTNILMVKFVSDSSIRMNGFSLSYRFLDDKGHCGGTYIKTQGLIYSPGWPGPYEPNKDCTWIISVPVGQQISLKIYEFDLEKPIRGNCDLGDHLTIRDGRYFNSPLIGKFCGSFQMRTIVSTTHNIFLEFHSDFYLNGNGFKIEWDGTVRGCGGSLTGYSGSISSPNYPEKYNENAECFYKITTSSGSTIKLNFTDLELEETPECADDYVEIFDGQNSNAKSFGKYCNLSKKPKNLETSSNFALIKFRSDFLLSQKGFLLNYIANCHTNITGSYGAIESPGYPDKYPSNSNCLWTITVPKGNVINVTFIDFNVFTSFRRRYQSTRISHFPSVSNHMYHRYEYSPIRRNSFIFNTSCNYDYVQIKETTDEKFSEKLCGSSLPKALTSKTNSIQIEFVSINYFASKGFRLEWIKHGCGGHFQQDTGSLSFDSIKNTNEEIECEWILETPVGTAVSITITDLYVADSENCTMDAIEIYNGQSISYPLINKICHRGGLTVQATSNFMLVRLVKRSSLRNIYLKSKFDSYRLGCGGLIRSPSGSIHSKNYPNNYENKMDCVWYIAVETNHKVELNFKDLDLYSDEDEDEQCDDYLKIFDGSRLIHDSNIYLGSKYLLSNYSYLICPKSNVSSIVSQHSSLSIQFSTNSYGTAKGFMIDYTTVCGAVINATHDGIINSNNYINSKIRNCTWTIAAPNLNDKIKLTIQYINIPQNRDVATTRNCPTTFLKVYDGDDEKAPLIDEYCGNKIPPMIVSHGNTLTVTHGTYINNVKGQFAAHYTTLSTGCGGKLSSEEGIIASPNYPLSYPVNIDCEWILNTSPGNRAYITFEKFDLDESERCNEDYLEVRENNGAGNLLGLYCGHEIPINQTISSKLYIKFHSNNDKTGQGFMLQYGFLHGNDISDKHEGEIASPLYPNPYYNEGVFSWRITTKGNKNIVINVESLEIPSYSDVCNNKLVIYDGYDEDALVLKELCGFFKNNAETIISSSGVIFIKLILDKTNTGAIFYLKWTETGRNTDLSLESKINCGINETQLVSRDIVIKSPNHLNEYESNSNCEWIFKTEPGRHLRLKFSEFKLEETPSCFADYVSIYTSHEELKWTPLKENMCLSSNATETIEALTYIKLNFVSDQSLNYKGFTAIISSVCGGLLEDKSGVIENSYYAQNNRRPQFQIICDWTIKVRPGRKVKLTFEHFNITNGDICNNYVVIKNGASYESPLLGDGKYCGYSHENRSGIVSSSSYVFVRYVKQNRYQEAYQNFRLRYEEKNIECGGTSLLENDHKWEIISSPNYPKIPTPYTECVWKFIGPPGEILRIDFTDRFDIDCTAESVEIRDGSTNVSPLKGEFCKQRPGTIKSSSNHLFVKYSTHVLVPRNGFKANISIDVCGATIVSDSGEVVSPNYPNMLVLPVGTICEWHITSPSSHIINLSFKDINLPESEIPCETKITIEDLSAADSKARNLKEFCDTDLDDYSQAIQSVSNKVIVKLHIGKPSTYTHISDSRGFKFTFKSSMPVCGGLLTASEGFITTPGYPGSTKLKYCQWIIILPNENRRVRLEIEDISSNIQFSAYNDITYGSKIVVTNSSSAINNKLKVYESTGNKLAFYIWLSPVSNVLSRFKAKFSSNNPTLCGGSLDGIQGLLTSPNITTTYNCEWHFTGPVSSENQEYKSIFIKVEGTTVCRNYAFGVSILSHIGTFRYNKKVCVNNTMVTYRLPTPYFQMKATQNNIPLFFTVNWKLQPCGGVVNVNSNDPINILNLPDKLDDQVECAWLLLSDSRTRMELKIEGAFNLACSDEYILISSGVNSLNIGDICKDKMQSQPLIISFTDTYVQYHSNIQSNRNVKLLAKTLLGQCGGMFTKFPKTFASPNFPHNYIENQECTWEIRADLGYRVSLQFIDRFAIEDTVNCTKDVVIIYDWVDNAYKEIARLCGRNLPPSFNSTHNQMKIVFRSDANITLDGFNAQWKPICGGNYVATHQTQFLYSPGYDYGYSRLLSCHYEITAPGKKIVLTFITFDLEGPVFECKYDNLTISYSENDYNFMDEIHCGTKLPSPIMASNNVKIDFNTDKYGQRKGFKISYSTYSCGGEVKNPTSITLDKGSNDMNCTWSIEAPPNKLVALKFDYIDIETSYECYNTYLAIFEGPLIDAEKRLALLCGRMNGTTLKSRGNKVILQYLSGNNAQSKGFKVKVLFSFSQLVGCGGDIYLNTSNNHILKSPLLNNALVYENYLDCHWNIKANLDYIIQVNIKSFHIAPCLNANQTALGFSNCDCDHLTLKDGLSPNSFVIGKYCGHNIPPPLSSSGNTLSLILSTDGDISSSGFEATLSAVPSLCGKSSYEISKTPQHISSPGYHASGVIPRSLHCSYYLNSLSNPYNLIHIQIKYLDLQPGVRDTCDQDKLVIYSHPKFRNATFGKDFIYNEDESSLMLYAHFYDSSLVFPKTFTLCGLKRSVDFYVTGSVKMNLMTSSDAASPHRGVDIEVSYVGICNKNYSEPQGRIQNTYESSSGSYDVTDCYTLITVPENHTISTYFLTVNPVFWSEQVFLEIFDGNVTTAPLLLNVSKEYTDNYPVFSNGRFMLLHNHLVNTDVITYDLVYVATDKGKGCGGKLFTESGRVTSPLYPEVYRRKTSCEWELETPSGTHIHLHFSVFDLGPLCDQNYLSLVNREGTTVSTFCLEMPADYTSSDNYVKIVFSTTMNNGGTGWVADFVGVA